jgi:hypothetical protein
MSAKNDKNLFTDLEFCVDPGIPMMEVNGMLEERVKGQEVNPAFATRVGLHERLVQTSVLRLKKKK